MLLLRSYTLAWAFRLKPSVLPVATRHFLTTSPNDSPAKTAGDEASSKPSAEHKSDDKPNDKSKKKPADVEKQEKPKIFRKKDLMPPSKRPLSAFATYALDKAKQQMANANRTTPFQFKDTLRECAAAWAKFSEAEKQPYAAPPEAYEAHRLALRNWKATLSPEAMSALKLRRRRKKGTGHALFVTETIKQAVGDTFGERIADRSAAWRALSSEDKEAYKKRAAETLFGVRAKRAAQHQRELEHAAKAKKKAAEKKAQELAKKKEKHEKEKLKKAELKKAEKAKAKIDKMKQELKVTGKKTARPSKETVKTTT